MTLKRLAPFLLAALLPRLAAAAPRGFVPLTLPMMPVTAALKDTPSPRSGAKIPNLPLGFPAALPGPKLPLLTPEGLAKLYGQKPPLPNIDLPGDDDFTAGVTADLIPPKKPLAPASAAALIFHEEPAAVKDLTGELERQLERLFDGTKDQRLVPAL